MMIVLLKFIGCSAILLFLFQFFLAKEKAFTLNRWALLLLLPIAMAVPFISLPLWFPQESAVNLSYPVLIHSSPSPAIDSSPVPQTIPTEIWLLLGYLTITSLLFAKKLNALIKLISWTKEGSVRPLNTARLILSNKVSTPFSFGNYIFLHPSTYQEGSETTKIIIAHELVHISQKHHIDLAMIEFLSVLCWFNPIVFMVKKAMVLNHEYLADQGVKEIVHPLAYKKLLLNLTMGKNPMVWTSAISSSTLKQRLIMLNKPQNKKAKHLNIGYFSLTALVILAGFSLKITAYPSESISPNSQLYAQAKQNNLLDKLPEFKGGMAAFSNYVKKEAEFPLHARKNGKEGQVLVQFVVEKDGSVSHVKATKGAGNGFEFLAERIIQNAPAFHPGIQNGRPVRVELTIPLIFSLSKDLSPTDKLPFGEVNLGEMTPNTEGLKVEADYINGVWKGTVKDIDGNSLPGALIKIEGTNIGTVTDIEGHFILKTKSPSPILISFTGYTTEKIKQK
ncbi:TonB family protein [uncultured Cyclobacterium sp.]|uniref:TonB family protein n=1 Tax=uncultured Cyclobacterium sp. TaxID=453820 RepID=UPI0030EBF86F|tara:strand:+ start:82 stop:1599 length:1518 start_codon:yes stop_codon:yes gene_type:complete